MSDFDWRAAREEAETLTDKGLLERMEAVARSFVTLWREADRRRADGLEINVGILSDRIGIIVTGHRRTPL